MNKIANFKFIFSKKAFNSFFLILLNNSCINVAYLLGILQNKSFNPSSQFKLSSKSNCQEKIS